MSEAKKAEDRNYLAVSFGNDTSQAGGYAFATMHQGGSDGVSLKINLTEDACIQNIEKFAAALGFIRSLADRKRQRTALRGITTCDCLSVGEEPKCP